MIEPRQGGVGDDRIPASGEAMIEPQQAEKR
jgi:hypothetical protein